RAAVPRRLNHEPACAAERDHVEHAEAFADQPGLDAKVGIAGGDNSHAPPRAIGWRTILPVGRDFDGGGLIAGTVRAVILACAVALGPDQHPPAAGGILPELLHAGG